MNESYVVEVAFAVGSAFLFVFKYREVIGFAWRILKWLSKPLKSVIEWAKTPSQLKMKQVETTEKLVKMEETLTDLSKFVKDKLNYNGGSSLVDAVRRVEGQLAIQIHAQNALLQDEDLGYFRCTRDGKNKWVNRTYSRFLGCGVNELLGLGWKKFIKMPELTRYNGVWQTAFADGCEFEDVVEFCDINNQPVRLKISASLITDDKGEIVEYLGHVVAL